MNAKARKKILQENIEWPRFNVKRRSLFIRHLDCGSCNACELELNALNNPVYDVAQYGIHFEASPRHADIVALTGILTRSLLRAALQTIETMPEARIITIGDCAHDSGVFRESYAITEDIPEPIKKAILAHVQGCPPSPTEIIEVLASLELK